MQLLIAHKEKDTRAALAKAIAGIEDNDFEVVESGEGEETLELLLDDHSPSLAVIDWDLPGLDGPEICRLVRDFSTGGPTYVVLLAGSRHPDIETGLEAGANDCIRTPARASEIRERVHAGLRFVQIPWEKAARGPVLEAVRNPDEDDDSRAESDGDVWSAGNDRDADAPSRGRIELQAVLSAS